MAVAAGTAPAAVAAAGSWLGSHACKPRDAVSSKIRWQTSKDQVTLAKWPRLTFCKKFKTCSRALPLMVGLLLRHVCNALESAWDAAARNIASAELPSVKFCPR